MEPEKHAKRLWLILGLALLLIAAGGFAAWRLDLLSMFNPGEQAESESPYQTTAAWRGDLTLSISGSGTVISDSSAELGFRSAGTVGTLNVEVGDVVSAGEVLAVLADTRALELAVKTQEVAVLAAQRGVEDYQSRAEAKVAQAQAELASAQAAYAEAQSNLHQQGEPRCPKSKTEEFYYAYLEAQGPVDTWEGHLNDPDTGYGFDYIMEHLNAYRKTRDQAYANWKYCEGYTAAEIQESEAAVQQTEAALNLAEQVYAELQASGGIDNREQAVAQASLANAQLQLEKARRDLEGAAIVAPIDGTVMAIAAEEGAEVGTETLITLTDLQKPRVQVRIDEADLPNIAAGCAAVITFDSLPGETFSGVVSEIAPSLVETQGVGYVQGTVDLDNTLTAEGEDLPLGLAAVVEVSCQHADGALLVPTQALYQKEDGGQYVFVLSAQGLPEQREVSVGLKTVASTEILSGITEGERVVISTVETMASTGTQE